MQIPIDKLKHFGVCFAGALVGGLFVDPWFAAAFMMAIGAAKEVFDKKGTGFSWPDMVANLGGALTGLAVHVII